MGGRLMPKVSVLMPIHNTDEAYLREAIESVLGQTYTDFEYIILNNSPANVALEDIVKSYKDDRIRLVRSEYEMGISKGRNKLMSLAKGEYFAVLDHDDVCLPMRLEEEVKVLDAHPEIGVVGCWVERFPATKIAEYPESNRDVERHLMTGCAVPHTAAMIRKSVLLDNNVQYEEEYSPSEDYCMWCRLLGKTQFYNIPKILMKYRWYEGNTSKSQADKMSATAKAIQTFVRAEHPDVWQDVCENAPHIVRMKLFGMVPCGRFIQKGNHRKGLLKYLPFITTKMKVTVVSSQEGDHGEN